MRKTINSNLSELMVRAVDIQNHIWRIMDIQN